MSQKLEAYDIKAISRRIEKLIDRAAPEYRPLLAQHVDHYVKLSGIEAPAVEEKTQQEIA